ncbi:hypothetical protein D3C78_20910 [compost metagenome]
MSDFLSNWFKDSKGFIYSTDDQTYITIESSSMVTGPIGVFPRIRKRNSLSDIKQLPGIILNKPLEQEASYIINDELYFYQFDKPIDCSLKATESVLSKLFSININEMKQVIIDIDQINGNGTCYQLEDLLNVNDSIIQPKKIDIDSTLSKSGVDMQICNILQDGYVKSTNGDSYITDLSIYYSLHLCAISADAIQYIFQQRLNTQRIDSIHTLFGISSPAQIPQGQEFIYNGSDGLYHAVMKKDGLSSTKVSNFTIEPSFTVFINDDEILYCNLLVDGSPTNPISCKFKKTDLLGWKEFIRSIPSSRVLWLAKDREVQLIRGWINAINVPKKKGVDKIGWHGDRYVLTNSSIKDGVLSTDDDMVYFDSYVPNINEKDISTQDFLDLAKELLLDCSNINEKITSMVSLAWFLCNPMTDVFREINQSFPILQIWGTRGSGKTTMVSILAKIFGTYGEPKSCNRTPFTLMRDLSLTNNIPLAMDEYKPSEIHPSRLDGLHYTLRLAYNASQDTRGDKALSMRVFTLTNPVAISGEMPFVDPALVERSIILNLRPQYVRSHPECAQAYNKILSTKYEPFLVGYMKWLTQWDMDHWIQRANDALTESQHISSGLNAPIRIIQNLSVVHLGLQIYQELTGEIVDISSIVRECFEQIIGNNATDALDRFMGFLNDMTIKGVINEGKEYSVSNNKLYFATDLCIASFSQYCQTHGLKSELTNKEAIRQQLLESKDSNSYTIEPYGKVHRMGNGRTIRCTVIDLNSLEDKTGINVDSWLKDEMVLDV